MLEQNIAAKVFMCSIAYFALMEIILYSTHLFYIDSLQNGTN